MREREGSISSSAFCRTTDAAMRHRRDDVKKSHGGNVSGRSNYDLGLRLAGVYLSLPLPLGISPTFDIR